MLSAHQFKQIVSGRRKGPIAWLVRGLLWLASLIYGVAVRIRNRRFDKGSRESKSVDVPVISVGNLTLGGTGKTPMVAWLARWLRQNQLRVTLISRGYGAEQGSQNDEAKELEQLLPDVPHLQNPDRVSAAEVAIEELAAQVLLLDDAFQHRQIARDLDVVLIDATEPFGYDYLFPRGTLREPIDGLHRADIIVLTRGDMISEPERTAIWKRLESMKLNATLAEMQHRPSRLINASGHSQTLDSWQAKNVLAFCGIGNPAGFRHTLAAAGMNVVELREFADHYAYQREDIETLTQWGRQQNGVDAIVCTHKDLVKVGLDQLGEVPLWALAIEADIIRGKDELLRQLEELKSQIPEDPYAID